MRARQFWVRIHRWAGLAMAGFLVIVGLTGSLLAFYDELDRWCCPEMYPAAHSDAPSLDFAILAEHAERLVPEARVTSVYFRTPARAEIRVSPRPDAEGKQPKLGYDTLFLDPHSGAELGRRTWGAISEGRVNIMSFIYVLHYELALGKPGQWMLGIVALIWTLDCFIGFYLTLPAGKTSRKPFMQRWAPAWRIKRGASAIRLHFDLHRAGGLWLWVVLLIFAWSSVYMNLYDTVYTWTTRAIMDYRPYWAELEKLPESRPVPTLSWREAQARGEALMQAEADSRGFSIKQPNTLRYDTKTGQFTYRVRSSVDFQDRRGRSMVFFDGNNGALSHVELPSTQHSGNTVTNWLANLHMANVFGLPWRIFVCVLGIAVTALSVTGILIWMRKRAACLA